MSWRASLERLLVELLPTCGLMPIGSSSPSRSQESVQDRILRQQGWLAVPPWRLAAVASPWARVQQRAPAALAQVRPALVIRICRRDHERRGWVGSWLLRLRRFGGWRLCIGFPDSPPSRLDSRSGRKRDCHRAGKHSSAQLTPLPLRSKPSSSTLCRLQPSSLSPSEQRSLSAF